MQTVTADARIRKKVAEARRLRAVSPQDGIRMGSDLTAFGRELSERARRAKH